MGLSPDKPVCLSAILVYNTAGAINLYATAVPVVIKTGIGLHLLEIQEVFQA
jgi:hypothetical protein